ncbi:hypothetical protein SY88_01695 [Clostridiales bacterium PH28_bin88]|nr:hypothetical protein SY88_01695 [Clostridiales bacterium PH28_bin88]
MRIIRLFTSICLLFLLFKRRVVFRLAPLFKRINRILVVTTFFVALAIEGYANQGAEEPQRTLVPSEIVTGPKLISKELFSLDDRVTEVPIQWSLDSKDLYFIAYQHDKDGPLEIWKFDGENKVKITEFNLPLVEPLFSGQDPTGVFPLIQIP